MKKNDNKKQTIYAVIAAILLIAVVIVGYGQIVHNSPSAAASKTVTYQIATPIQGTLDQSSLSQLTNIAQTQDFAVQLNTTSGLGNTSPFGG